MRRTASLITDLSRLALGEEGLVAHPAVAAGDLERDHHPVAGLEVHDVTADLLDDAHRLVAEDVTRGHERAQGLVEVQIRPADVGAGDLDDRI